jgi:hypothetical protein
MNTTDPSKRPSQRSPEILEAAAVELLKTLADKDTPHTDPSAVDQVAKALNGSSSWDGYDICRELESRFYWQPDAQMVDTFDGAFSVILQAHRAKVASWVSEKDIRPQKAVGDVVDVTYRGESYQGEITAVRTETAEYTVMIPALGHVREGLGTHGMTFKFEEIHPLAEPAEEFELRPQGPRG